MRCDISDTIMALQYKAWKMCEFWINISREFIGFVIMLNSKKKKKKEKVGKRRINLQLYDIELIT